MVGETAFTIDFLDDAAGVVAFLTESAAIESLRLEKGATMVTQTNIFTFLKIPYR